MDRKIFKRPIGKDGLTPFQCPTCGTGNLRIEKDTFNFEETKLSKAGRSHEAWEPDWVDLVFGCLLQCTNTTCKETIACCGTGSVSEYLFYDEDGKTCGRYDEYFHPKLFVPHLKFFDFPKDVPDPISDELSHSFASFFNDSSASANHARRALEHVLTELKVNRFVNHKGRRNYLSLHARIDKLPKKFDHIKDLFLAIKWLGNAGSHAAHETTKDDVLDAYELMDELLVQVFSNKGERAASLAKKINRKKGPNRKPQTKW